MKKIMKTLMFALMLLLVLVAVAACNRECEHTGGTATCTEQAICEKCGESYGEPAGHTLVDVEALGATCTTDGYTAHKACACGYTEGKDVIPAGHTLVDVEALDATCTTDGYTAHKACACGYTEGKDVVPAGHTYVDGVCACGAVCPHTDVAAGETCGVCGVTLPEQTGGDVQVVTATLTPNVTANINSFTPGEDITSYTSLAGSEIFTLTVGDKTNNSNQVYLSTGGEIRLYSDSSDNLGNTLTITSTKKIVSIAITYSGTTRSGATFIIGDTTVAGGTSITEETITVDANSVTIANNKSSGQLRITSIVITYEE